MNQNLTQKIIAAHLVEGDMTPGNEVAIKIDQTLTQDATGTMAYLQWEAIGLPRVKTELSVSYVDHNTLQMGFRNPDDHRYLRSVAAKYGIVFSPPGTGICHQLHLENFAVPGKTLIGSDSHTPTAGGTVKGGVGAVMEYCGPGVATLSVPERATITNMGAELGATASVFPSDEQTRAFLALMGRENDFTPLAADEGAAYDREIVIDLSTLAPLAARPHMPDRVVPVAELDGMAVDQVAIGSCTTSSYSDLQSVAQILHGEHIAPNTDLLLSPGSKQVLKMLMSEGLLDSILDAGGRLMECSCGPCIGMGGSPSSAGVSARTFNRNFEGRSGTQDGQVYLVSPITAAFAALNGKFTNPATWTRPVSKPSLPAKAPSIRHLFAFPPQDGSGVEIQRGPNIVALSPFDRLPDSLELPVLIKVGDNITTDHIMPAGAAITALRSNIPAISRHVFERVDKDFVSRAEAAGQGLILGGENYGQGSSREHAALAPRHLGVRIVLAKSFARIHKANLINFGILPLVLANEADYDALAQGDVLHIDLCALAVGQTLSATAPGGRQVTLSHDLTGNEIAIIKAGGLLNFVNDRQK
jgi:aconitate hydratase